MATKEQIKRIYGLGAGLGIVGKDKDDMLHELIFSITGKDSVKQLDDSEFKAVQAELINRMKLADPNHLLHKHFFPYLEQDRHMSKISSTFILSIT